MENLKNSIKEIIQTIQNTTKLFYQQKNQEGFAALDATLDTLMKGVSDILIYHKGKEELINENMLNVVLTEAMKALEQKDTILLSDILIYEVNDMLEECLSRI